MFEFKAAKVAFVIACDDVRREDNGKLIFIGIYGNNILLNDFPGNLTLRFATKLVPHHPGAFDLEIRARFRDEIVGVMLSHTESRDGSAEISSTPPLTVVMPEAGTLYFEARDIGAEWKTLLELPVMTFAQWEATTFSTASPPPS